MPERELAAWAFLRGIIVSGRSRVPTVCTLHARTSEIEFDEMHLPRHTRRLPHGSLSHHRNARTPPPPGNEATSVLRRVEIRESECTDGSSLVMLNSPCRPHSFDF